METPPLTFTLALEPVHCPKCGITFLVPQAYIDQRRRDGRRMSCPNGHRLWFPRTPTPPSTPAPAEVQKLRRQLVKAVHDAEQAEARAQDASSAS
jgi:hypothetical protein